MKSRSRTVLLAVVVAVSALVARSDGLLAAALIGGAAVLAVGLGVRGARRGHDRAWRRCWAWLTLAAVAHGVSSVLAIGAAGGSLLSTLWLGSALVGAAASAVGVVCLLLLRLPRGRAVDVVAEGLVGALAVGLLLWTVVVDSGRLDAVTLAGTALLLTADLVALWLLVRLLGLTADHPVAYRYLGAGQAIALAGHGLAVWDAVGGRGSGPLPGAIVLWGLCLVAVAALHPTLAERFAPVPPRPATLARGHVALLVVGIVLGPVVVAWRLVQGGAPTLPFVLAGTTVFPLVVIAHLVRQVQERASGEYRAQHDELTGLPNQVLFGDRLDVALARARRWQGRVGVLFLDLDGFKEVNDRLGHDVGNRLLRVVGGRLRRLLREEDTVARWGGDEFTVLLTDVDGAAGAGAVAEKVLAVFAEPFDVGGRLLSTGASIGVAVFPDDGGDAETLLKNADTAMYRAKARGRSGYQLYTSDMSVQDQLKLALEGGLRMALAKAELAVHYQPRIDQRTSGIVGIEALARWEHPSLGTIAPAAFIPLAEESGLIHPLGHWVLEAACAQAATWRDAGLIEVPISVNLSARELLDADVEQRVAEVLRSTGLPADLLELELTEAALLRDDEALRERLERLRGLGVRCAIDDLGTGYTGLASLAGMPVESLKIDRAFVAAIDSEAGAPMVEAVIALARGLGLRVVAEGVETEEQVRFLSDRGCFEMQGYFFSEPLAPAAFEQLTREIQAGRLPRPLGPEAAASRATSPSQEDAAETTRLLVAAFQQRDLGVVRERLDEVLAALAPTVDVEPWRLHLPGQLPVRVAAGSFAGLLPLSTGLAGGIAAPGTDAAVSPSGYLEADAGTAGGADGGAAGGAASRGDGDANGEAAAGAAGRGDDGADDGGVGLDGRARVPVSDRGEGPRDTWLGAIPRAVEAASRRAGVAATEPNDPGDRDQPAGTEATPPAEALDGADDTPDHRAPDDPAPGDSGAGDSGAGDSGAGDSGAGGTGTGDTGTGETGTGDTGTGGDDPRERTGGGTDTDTDTDTGDEVELGEPVFLTRPRPARPENPPSPRTPVGDAPAETSPDDVAGAAADGTGTDGAVGEPDGTARDLDATQG